MADPRFWILFAGELVLAGIGIRNYLCCRRASKTGGHDEELQKLREEFRGHREEISRILNAGINVSVARVMEDELDHARPQKT